MIYEDLRGKKVLVTGSSSGIEAAISSSGLLNNRNQANGEEKTDNIL